MENATDQTKQIKRNSAGFYVLVVLIVVLGYFAFGYFYKNTPDANPIIPTPTSAAIQLSDYFSYPGETGKTALQILEEKAKTEQDATGMVSSINGRKANTDNREYWAFYINGKLASVGPADYQTNPGEVIEWRIEKY